MKITPKLSLRLILILVIFSLVIVSPAQARTPVIHAVLFYSPTCSHCHKVIAEDLSVLQEEYDDQLLIIIIDIQTEEGNQLFSDALDYFGIPYEQAGVPLLIIGEQFLFGSVDIPEKFPGIIKDGLEDGGIAWTKIPSLEDVLRREGLYDDEEIALAQDDEISFEAEELTALESFQQDPVGNSISVVVLMGMVIILICSAMLIWKDFKGIDPWPKSIFIILLIIGFIVAGYLSFVEMSQSEAVCGPVGDCNTVQQSPYATLFGFLPIGVLGLLGYSMIGIAWLAVNFGPKTNQRRSYLVLIGLTAIGTIFSIYLTFLEPFVIGATCAWCLTSAIVITALLWISSIAYMEAKE